MNERLEQLEALASNNMYADDLGNANEGDPDAIFNITRYHHPRIFSDEDLLEDFKYTIDEKLEEGKPNTLATYEEAAREVYEERDIPLPTLSPSEVENLQEQDRFRRGIEELKKDREQALE